jgi:oxalyl-CoA decarboxylase
MEIETICRYWLPVTVVILNNGGVYRGDEIAAGTAASGMHPAPTVLNARARHELMAEAFGGKGYHVTGGGERTPGEPQPDQRGHTGIAAGQRRRVIPTS